MLRPLLPALLLAAPVAAQEAPDPRTFQPPAGCTAYLTVQMASCTVSHHFTCEADPPGWQRRVDMDEAGVTYFGAIDAETQWMESNHVLSAHSERLGPAPRDPASLTELLATGRDTWSFETLSDEIGPTRYVGEDRLVGGPVTIDGVTLERTEYEIRALGPDGAEAWSGHGQEYVSRDWRMFLSGVETDVVGGEATEHDDTPVEFVMPGEPGFLGVAPRHGCGELMSKRAQ